MTDMATLYAPNFQSRGRGIKCYNSKTLSSTSAKRTLTEMKHSHYINNSCYIILFSLIKIDVITTDVLTWSLGFKSTVTRSNGKVLTRVRDCREEQGIGTFQQVPS